MIWFMHYMWAFTHLPMGKVAKILKVKFSNSPYRILAWAFAVKLLLRWMPQNLMNERSTLVHIMAWCRQATSHYLNPCLPRFMLPYGVTRPHWVKASQIIGTSHEHHGITNWRQLKYLFNSLCKLTRKKTSELHITGHLWPMDSPHKGQ